MTPSPVSDDAPGTNLLPEFTALYDLIAHEVEGLSDRQLDFRSDRWAWSDWSIRQQVSHLTYAIFSWLTRRLGHILFPHGEHGVQDLDKVIATRNDRRLDEKRYWALDDILGKLRDGIALMQQVLNTHNAGFLRRQTYGREGIPEHWRLMAQAHPNGITLLESDDVVLMTLEACLRHVYFEAITHLFNIQRLKRAQGLPTRVEIPHVGYWVVPGWDRSEA